MSSQPTYKEWKGRSLVQEAKEELVPSLPTRNGKGAGLDPGQYQGARSQPTYKEWKAEDEEPTEDLLELVPSLPTRNGK